MKSKISIENLIEFLKLFPPTKQVELPPYFLGPDEEQYPINNRMEIIYPSGYLHNAPLWHSLKKGEIPIKESGEILVARAFPNGKVACISPGIYDYSENAFKIRVSPNKWKITTDYLWCYCSIKTNI